MERKMKVKGIIDEDFINYKKPSMYIAFPKCSFKCDKECGRAICQNSALVKEKDIEISINKIINRYVNNPITKSIVCGGLEPLDSWDDLQCLIINLRYFLNWHYNVRRIMYNVKKRRCMPCQKDPLP